MDKKWFVNKKRLSDQKYRQSPAEKRVEGALKRMAHSYKCEISFVDCKSKKGNHLIFDFIVPDFQLLIEYDGADYHDTQVSYENDSIKNKYAAENGYYLLRLNQEHWDCIESRISKKISVIKSKKRGNKIKEKNVHRGIGAISKNKMKRKAVAKGKYAKVRVTINDWASKDTPIIQFRDYIKSIQNK